MESNRQDIMADRQRAELQIDYARPQRMRPNGERVFQGIIESILALVLLFLGLFLVVIVAVGDGVPLHEGLALGGGGLASLAGGSVFLYSAFKKFKPRPPI